MVRGAQFGIALGVLGIMLTFMGLFPGVTGVQPVAGIGIAQIFSILAGFTLLIFGGLIYVEYSFYAHVPANLAQQIGWRVALTGLVLSGMAGLADILGFGSHPRTATSDILFGAWQAAGMIGGFFIASIGVLIYALTGDEDDDQKNGS
jgi:hypothetical protein